MQRIKKAILIAIFFSLAFTSLLSASNDPIIVSQPNNIAQCVGGNEALKVAISAKLTAVYQWQESSDNENWAHIRGATQATYTPESQNVGRTWYRVLVTTQGEGARAVASRSVEVKIVETPKVSITMISSKSLNTRLTFKATRSGGAGTCSIQWQVSENGAPWSNIEGATGDELKAPVSVIRAKYKAVQYCTGSGCCN